MGNGAWTCFKLAGSAHFPWKEIPGKGRIKKNWQEKKGKKFSFIRSFLSLPFEHTCKFQNTHEGRTGSSEACLYFFFENGGPSLYLNKTNSLIFWAFTGARSVSLGMHKKKQRKKKEQNGINIRVKKEKEKKKYIFGPSRRAVLAALWLRPWSVRLAPYQTVSPPSE